MNLKPTKFWIGKGVDFSIGDGAVTFVAAVGSLFIYPPSFFAVAAYFIWCGYKTYRKAGGTA